MLEKFFDCAPYGDASGAGRHQALIVMDTHAEKRAHVYVQDMPGLRVMPQLRTINGPTWSRCRSWTALWKCVVGGLRV